MKLYAQNASFAIPYITPHTPPCCEVRFGRTCAGRICLLRPPSTSGCAIRPPSSSLGEPGEGAVFPGLELALLRAQQEQKLPPKRGRLGGEPRGSTAVAWPGSPSANFSGGSCPSCRLDGQHGAVERENSVREAYFGRGKRRSHSTQAPSAGREQRGCPGRFCQI